jgi:hypothetical protein
VSRPSMCAFCRWFEPNDVGATCVPPGMDKLYPRRFWIGGCEDVLAYTGCDDFALVRPGMPEW